MAGLLVVTIVAASLLLALATANTQRSHRHFEELRQANAARDKADMLARDHEDRLLRTYPSDVRKAQQAWKDGRVAEAKNLLEKHLPGTSRPDHRTFAWHYMQRLCQLDGPTLGGQSGPIYACRFSRDGQILASARADGLLRLWDPTSGRLQHGWETNIPDVNSISISPNGKWLAATAGDAGAAVWELQTGQLVRKFMIESGSVIAIVLESGTAALDSSDKPVSEAPADHAATSVSRGPVKVLEFMPDGQSICASGAGVIEFFDTADWRSHRQVRYEGKPIRMIAVSPDGAMLASIRDAPEIELWDSRNVRPTATLAGHTRGINAIVFSNDGNSLASCSEDGTVRIWNVAQRRERKTWDNRHGYIHDVAFTPDDHWVAAAAHSGHVEMIDVLDGTRGRVMWSNSIPYTLAVSPDGRQLATGSAWSDPPVERSAGTRHDSRVRGPGRPSRGHIARRPLDCDGGR